MQSRIKKIEDDMKEIEEVLSDEKMIQLTVEVDSYIFALTTTPEKHDGEDHAYIRKVNAPIQVDDVINNEQFVTCDRYTNTGFMPEVIRFKSPAQREIIHTRLVNNFSYSAALIETTIYQKNALREWVWKKTYTEAKLIKTHSMLDLYSVRKVSTSIVQGKQFEFTPGCELAMYNGHTLFSLFFNHLGAYKSIEHIIENYKQLKGENGLLMDACENAMVRHLYRLLIIPTRKVVREK